MADFIATLPAPGQPPAAVTPEPTTLTRLRRRDVEKLRVVSIARGVSIAEVFRQLAGDFLDRAYQAVVAAGNLKAEIASKSEAAP